MSFRYESHSGWSDDDFTARQLRSRGPDFAEWLEALLHGFTYVGSNIEDNHDHEVRFREFQYGQSSRSI